MEAGMDNRLDDQGNVFARRLIEDRSVGMANSYKRGSSLE